MTTSGDDRERMAAAEQAARALPAALHPSRIDPAVHHPMRLTALAALAVTPVLTFPELKRALEATDGNLGEHLKRLEAAGYVAAQKHALARGTRTEYRLTPAGRRALARYLDALQALIDTTRAVLPPR